MEIKFFTLLLILIFTGCQQNQDKKINTINIKDLKVINSKWYHFNSDSSDVFEIELSIKDNMYISGKHVFTFDNGKKIDASLKNKTSINGSINNKQAEVVWKSSFCDDSAKMVLFFQTDSTMLFIPITGCTGEIGHEVIFKKQDTKNND